MENAESKFLNEPLTHLFLHADSFLNSIQDQIHEFQDQFDSYQLLLPEFPKYSSQVLPEYDSLQFTIFNFESKLIFDDEFEYSEFLKVFGYEWRLKICAMKDGYLSAFIELVKDLNLESVEPQTFQYKIQLVSHSKIIYKRNITKENESEFHVGDCWGYAKFIKIQEALQEEFHDTDSDSITFQFSIRPKTFAQKCHLQDYYIRNLQLQLSELGYEESFHQENQVASDDVYVQKEIHVNLLDDSTLNSDLSQSSHSSRESLFSSHSSDTLDYLF